jgi:hypothetical protein
VSEVAQSSATPEGVIDISGGSSGTSHDPERTLGRSLDNGCRCSLSIPSRAVSKWSVAEEGVDGSNGESQSLPFLSGFLYKLSPQQRFFRIWQKRFFFTRGDELCYSRHQLDLSKRDEILDWELSNAIAISSIKRIYSTGERKSQFVVEVRQCLHHYMGLSSVVFRLAIGSMDACVNMYSRHHRVRCVTTG